MQKTVTAALVAALLSLTGAAQAGTGIDLQANETPIHAPKNPQAIAKLPADFRFVKPGRFTVAIAALNTPPLATTGGLSAAKWISRNWWPTAWAWS